MLGLHDALGKFAVGDAANTIPGVVAVHDTGQVSSSRANFAYIMDQPCQRAAEQVKPDDKTTGLHYSCASLLGLELMKLPIAAILTQAALTLWHRPGHEELKALCKWLGTPFETIIELILLPVLALTVSSLSLTHVWLHASCER